MKAYVLFACYEWTSDFKGVFTSKKLAEEAQRILENTTEDFIPDSYLIKEIGMDYLI